MIAVSLIRLSTDADTRRETLTPCGGWLGAGRSQRERKVAQKAKPQKFHVSVTRP